MALEQARFFDSVDDDREYSADEHAEFFRAHFTNGVIELGTNLQVTPDTGLSVKVGYGAAVLEGYGYWLKTDAGGAKTLALVAAETLPRIDRVVVQLDKSVENRTAKLAVKKGTAAASPSAPGLTRSGNIYEISLARIAVAANATNIVAGNITDERSSTSACGIVQPRYTSDKLNQGVRTTDSPTFANTTVTTKLTAAEVVANKVTGAVYM